MKKKIVILGYGGHAKSVLDCIWAKGDYEVVGYTDVVDKHGSIPYLGTDDQLRNVFESGTRTAVFGMGFMGESMLRDKLYDYVKQIGFELPVMMDPSALVARDVSIGEGTFVGKRAVINADSHIGKMCIINTGSIIEHENEVKDFSHVAVGAVLCGNVTIGDHCLIGANSTVLQGITIGSHSIVGAGSVVLSDVDDHMTVVGIPAKEKRA